MKDNKLIFNNNHKHINGSVHYSSSNMCSDTNDESREVSVRNLFFNYNSKQPIFYFKLKLKNVK